MVELSSGVGVITLSPHSTKFSDGNTVEAASKEVVDATSLIDDSITFDHVGESVEMISFSRRMSDKFAQTLVGLIREADSDMMSGVPLLVLVPAMLSSLPEEDWDIVRSSLDNSIERTTWVVAFIATPETQRAKPSEKIAQANRFSAIAKLN